MKKKKLMIVDIPGGLVSNTLLPNDIHTTHDVVIVGSGNVGTAGIPYHEAGIPDVIIVGNNGPEIGDIKTSAITLSDAMSRVNHLNMKELNLLDTIYSPFDKKRNTNMTPPKKKRKKK
jgi:uncharacterized protein YceK